MKKKVFEEDTFRESVKKIGKKMAKWNTEDVYIKEEASDCNEEGDCYLLSVIKTARISLPKRHYQSSILHCTSVEVGEWNHLFTKRLLRQFGTAHLSRPQYLAF